MTMRIGFRSLFVIALAAAVAGALAAGCSKSGKDGPPGDAAGEPSATRTAPAAGSPSAAATSAPSPGSGAALPKTPGPHIASIDADGVTRWFTYYVPSSYNAGTAAALVFAFHGGNGSMQNIATERTDLLALADRDGFIAVLPNGQSDTNNRGSSTWNAVWCCGYAHQVNKSDVEFVRKMVQALSGALNIDAKRIHAMGFSNGGMLTYRLAAEIPDTLASVAVFGAVAGGRYPRTEITRTVPTKPVPLLIMHGQADRTAPIEGGESEQFAELIYMSQADSLAIYTTSYHCNPTPANSVIQGRKGRIVVSRFAGCDADLITMLMENVAHGWPDTSFAGFDGTAQAWEFLKTHPKP